MTDSSRHAGARTFAALRAFATLLILLSAHNVTGQTSKALKAVNGVYRELAERTSDGISVWIVDGAQVREAVYPEFVYGGNAQRYRFNPKGEVWIDNAISAEEYPYTLAHELIERRLMARYGWTYTDAHDSALRLERQMRTADSALCHKHEARLPLVSSYDDDSIKEIPSLPDSIRLSNIYEERLQDVQGIQVWIVDGRRVRRTIYPDFGFSGNDEVYYFIPKNEIWIDDDISCEETKYSIEAESIERTLMQRGMDYDEAYERALTIVLASRATDSKAAQRHPIVEVPNPPDRDIGTGDERP